MGDQNALGRVRTDWQGSNAGRGLCSARHVKKYKNNTNEASMLLKIKKGMFNLVQKRTQIERPFACPVHDSDPKTGCFASRKPSRVGSDDALWKVRIRTTGICRPEVREIYKNSGNEPKKLLKTKEVMVY
jgi:hypothetical protein